MSDPHDWSLLFAKRRQRSDEPDDEQVRAAVAAWKLRLQDDDATAEPRLDDELTELLTRIHDAG